MSSLKKCQSNFSYIDKEGRRLSIFAERVGDTLDIVIIPCSKKKKFDSEKSWDIYKKLDKDEYHVHQRVCLVITGGKTDRFTFENWCEKNYEKYIPKYARFAEPLFRKGE